MYILCLSGNTLINMNVFSVEFVSLFFKESTTFQRGLHLKLIELLNFTWFQARHWITNYYWHSTTKFLSLSLMVFDTKLKYAMLLFILILRTDNIWNYYYFPQLHEFHFIEKLSSSQWDFFHLKCKSFRCSEVSV